MTIRLGVMGGTFNPPHRGHLEAARHVRAALGLDRVLFVPNNIPPHKRMPAHSATTAQRCEMVGLMVRDEPWAALSTIEVDRGGASYTVETLRALAGEGQALTLIIGTDMLMTLEQWREPAEICRLATLATVARSEDDRAALKRQAARLQGLYGADVRLVDCPALPVSSTQLREQGGFDCLTPPAVAAYIEEHHLYR
ncbi:nicotinate (nicotinamide) nucleotide adenylyltransferase [Intestinibacillus massiliensis]|nr:nicotinate (nicotinamide) nucleotide adenylyltransferase [Intestinibacillus massiliensis]